LDRSHVIKSRTGIVLLLLAGAAGGCFGNKLPPLEQYRLAPSPDSTALGNPPNGPLPGSIAISKFLTPGIYGGDQIVYRIGETGYGTYPSREWALPLGEMLGLLAEETLRRDPIGTEAVYGPASRQQFEYEWRGTVKEFEEVNRDNRVYASVKLEARLLRTADDSIIWRGERSAERPVPDPTMSNIVDEISTAARQVMRELALDAKTAARSLSADNSPP
jgi:ABC-type uncharacterized transport system auxiliary subunit